MPASMNSRSFRIVIALAGVCVLAGGLFIASWLERAGTPDGAEARPGERLTATHGSSAPDAGRQRSANDDTRERLAAMRRRFDMAEDYAAFIQHALGSAESGGLLYALLAYTRCQRATALASEQPELPNPSAEQLEAEHKLERLNARCARVQTIFPDARVIYLAPRDTRRADPGLAPGVMSGSGKSSAALKHGLAQAVATGDPWAVSKAGIVWAGSKDPALGGRILDQTEREAFTTEFMSLPCALGEDCASLPDSLSLCLADASLCGIPMDVLMRRDRSAEDQARLERTRAVILEWMARGSFGDGLQR